MNMDAICMHLCFLNIIFLAFVFNQYIGLFLGECVLALKSMFAIKPQKFCSSLMHLGEETGFIR